MPGGQETNQLIDNLFNRHLKSFHIHAKRRVINPYRTARYIGRYVRHPAIAESSIANLDKNLKLVRYYGLYARNTRSKLQKILTPLSREKPKPQPNKTPIKCPKCVTSMQLIGITRPS
jgi:hypothetical protein